MFLDIYNSEIIKNIEGTKIGASFIFAFVVGYFLKKSVKLMFIILIIVLAIMFWLDYSKIAELKNYDFSNSLDRIAELFKMFGAFIFEKVDNINFSSAFGLVTGLLLGLKFG